jgi:hypothetical protein
MVGSPSGALFTVTRLPQLKHSTTSFFVFGVGIGMVVVVDFG